MVNIPGEVVEMKVVAPVPVTENGRQKEWKILNE